MVDNSPFLLEGQCLYLPCHWTPVYEQNFCLCFRESRHFEGMRPFVSRFRGLGLLSLCLPCARHEYFYVGSMVLGSLLSAWSHSFCQRANLSALVSGFYGSSCPLGGIRRPPGCGCRESPRKSGIFSLLQIGAINETVQPVVLYC
eukprot:Gb_23905 [translate_table: standard]